MDGRIGHSGNVNGGKMTFMENRKKEKDERGELADQNDVLFGRVGKGAKENIMRAPAKLKG